MDETDQQAMSSMEDTALAIYVSPAARDMGGGAITEAVWLVAMRVARLCMLYS